MTKRSFLEDASSGAGTDLKRPSRGNVVVRKEVAHVMDFGPLCPPGVSLLGFTPIG